MNPNELTGKVAVDVAHCIWRESDRVPWASENVLHGPTMPRSRGNKEDILIRVPAQNRWLSCFGFTDWDEPDRSGHPSP